MTARFRGLPLASLVGGLVLALLLVVSLGAPRRLVSLLTPGTALHQLDGRVAPGEYGFSWDDPTSALRFSWSILGDRLLGAIQTPDSGWVAVGFGGEGPLMYGADIVIGQVDARGAHLRDHFADSPTSHLPDTALGGHNDVLAGAGVETAEGTTIEFERPLAAHDTTDRALAAGETPVILASAGSDDFMEYHAGGRKAVALLDLFAGPPARAASGGLLPDHLTDVQILLATWAALLLVMGVHGLLETVVARGAGAAPEAPVSDLAVATLVALLLVELAALGTFAAGVALAAPTWLLGLTLAVGLFALACIVVAYSRVFVRWDVVTRERDDGIPW